MEFVLPRDPKYGWIPDLPDQRDFPYTQYEAVIPVLRGHADLRVNCTPVENQGKLGSCTACALVGNLEYIKLRSLKRIINFSKLFLYYNERVITRQQGTDSGASLRDGIKTLRKTGDCLETLWPYVVAKFRDKPTPLCYRDAGAYQITSYYRLHSLNDMKHTLASGYPFVFGFAVYESFESKRTGTTGIVSMPAPRERVIGGHAVCAVGYDEGKRWFIIRNSWGPRWGDGGYFYLPYDYISRASLAADFWTIRDME